MKRKQLDTLLTAAGAIVAVMLVAAAGLSYWGQNFAESQVRAQLVREKIYFPAAGAANFSAQEYPGLQQYAGSQVDSGVKAKAYADEYIWHHMMKASGGKTYAEVSALAMAAPQDAKLSALKTTLFQGDMLRSSLLTAYAFSVFGSIAHWAFVASVAGAVMMTVLVILGFWHIAAARRR